MQPAAVCSCHRPGPGQAHGEIALSKGYSKVFKSLPSCALMDVRNTPNSHGFAIDDKTCPTKTRTLLNGTEPKEFCGRHYCLCLPAKHVRKEDKDRPHKDPASTPAKETAYVSATAHPAYYRLQLMATPP